VVLVHADNEKRAPINIEAETNRRV